MRMRTTLAATALTAAAVLAGTGTAAAGGGGGATAYGVAANSPGFLSGNLVQIPIDADVNVCGNSVGILGGGGPTYGIICITK
ncbi:chaplin [Streptomyces sp. LS1784]|uniref:chaplin n=1 Tax=Streptomyces sp. LS1784 TaxID=2851533 RepID=UPI001CCEA458|nr:chaplin [Streptomyces sp. LS1784]